MIDLSALDIESSWFKAGQASDRRLLGIFAHPDDETFGPGATLARYAQEGVDVHVLTMTDGAVGDLLTDLPAGVNSLAELRRYELQCAVQVLGAAALHTLRYRDSGMPGTPANQDPGCLFQADRQTVIKQLCAVIRAVQPQVIITHDSTGAYFHPDHIRTWELATVAVQSAGDPTKCTELTWPPHEAQFLYYTAVPKSRVNKTVFLARLSLRNPRRWGRNGDIDLTQLGVPDEQINVRVNVRDYLGVKDQARLCHRSQGGDNNPRGWFSQLFQKRISGVSNWDYFIQAFPAPSAHAQRKQQLFA